MLSLYNNKLNGILADEMGLGKTVQVCKSLLRLVPSTLAILGYCYTIDALFSFSAMLLGTFSHIHTSF